MEGQEGTRVGGAKAKGHKGGKAKEWEGRRAQE